MMYRLAIDFSTYHLAQYNEAHQPVSIGRVFKMFFSWDRRVHGSVAAENGLVAHMTDEKVPGTP